MNYWLVIISSVITLANVIGNGLTIYAIIIGRLVKKTSFFFITFLAVCDIVFGLSMYLRLILLNSLNLTWCKVILGFVTCSGLLTSAGILMLGIELYYTFKHIDKPNAMALYKKWKPYVGVLVVVMIVMVLSLLSVVFGVSEAEYNLPTGNECVNDKVANTKMLLILQGLSILMYVSILIIFGLLYRTTKISSFPDMIHNRVRPMNAETPAGNNSQTVTMKQETKVHTLDIEANTGKTSTNTAHLVLHRQRLQIHKKVTRVTFGILILYTVTWVPFLVVLYIRQLTSIPITVLHVSVLILTVNSFGNTIVYYFLSKELRALYKQMLCLKCLTR